MMSVQWYASHTVGDGWRFHNDHRHRASGPFKTRIEAFTFAMKMLNQERLLTAASVEAAFPGALEELSARAMGGA